MGTENQEEAEDLSHWKAYFIVGLIGTIIMFPAMIVFDEPTEPLPIAALSVIGLLAFVLMMFVGLAARSNKITMEGAP
ncbi:MAG TPA: hypothetical protein VKF15_05880 [Nitrososphaerales archaeon]|nr:hypothetical protein [Nitrososphaerales archaeon]